MIHICLMCLYLTVKTFNSHNNAHEINQGETAGFVPKKILIYLRFYFIFWTEPSEFEKPVSTLFSSFKVYVLKCSPCRNLPQKGRDLFPERMLRKKTIVRALAFRCRLTFCSVFVCVSAAHWNELTNGSALWSSTFE